MLASVGVDAVVGEASKYMACHRSSCAVYCKCSDLSSGSHLAHCLCRRNVRWKKVSLRAFKSLIKGHGNRIHAAPTIHPWRTHCYQLTIATAAGGALVGSDQGFTHCGVLQDPQACKQITSNTSSLPMLANRTSMARPVMTQ